MPGAAPIWSMKIDFESSSSRMRPVKVCTTFCHGAHVGHITASGAVRRPYFST